MGKVTGEMQMNITVYLGANEGSDPALKQAVEELGRWIGESGNALVYGGSRSGLMGRLAHSVLTAGLYRLSGRHRHAGRDRRGDVQGLAGPSGRALHPL